MVEDCYYYILEVSYDYFLVKNQNFIFDYNFLWRESSTTNLANFPYLF